MNKSEAINELATALCLAQAHMKGAVKDSSNPFFKSKYADLESVWDAIRDPLTKNGLSVIQTTGFDEQGGSYVETVLAHKSGQWISGKLLLHSLKPEPQAVGSAISYARRYALAAIVGIYQTDDDGETAQGRAPQQKEHQITEVTDVPQRTPVRAQAPAAKQDDTPGYCCGKLMLPSKFKQGEVWCTVCRRKEMRAA